MAMVRAKKNIVSYVRELKPRKDTSRIEVRIVLLWRNYNKESGNTIEMVVVDKEEIGIHASVGEGFVLNIQEGSKDLWRKFLRDIQEGLTEAAEVGW
ncbi:hypothetical protein F2Q69_00011096 [Brassica cretica]|uniref:Replication protein A 70 kDa DNA-binding subunit B/D first OB fold domain-containing protein n=1 Tax=Brassica cretica TaxID=69181 RepID=A0A8S9QY36_BRACR|nr:hypothetical protein F2Q69_00011096 [Brassica cretica]